MAKASKDAYALDKSGGRRMAAPQLPYRPRDPGRYRPKIGLIACGGITAYHLRAYKRAGYDVVALCDVCREKAQARQAEFYPRAAVYDDYRAVLKRDDIDVVDISTHPSERVEILKAAIAARKHILSQKPFVTDLDAGQRLVDLADRRGVKLAVNQNGRWAPHFSYIRSAIDAGLLGQVISAHLNVHWDHNWVAGTPFDSIRHIVLYDFAIHWFDIVNAFLKRPAKRVYASYAPSPEQKARPNLLAQCLIEFEDAQASLAFDANARFGPEDRTYVAGTRGSVSSLGPNLGQQQVTLYTARGQARPKLKGTWFEDGFHGTMAELLCAIEENRQPNNNARDNLNSLALCFAAVASAERHEPQTPGKVRRLPK